jgi:hypothetical protein
VLTSLVALIVAAAITGHQPQLAQERDRVYLVVARDAQVGVLRSGDAGRSFVEATPIAVTGRMAAGMHRGPRVAVTRSSVLVALVAGVQGGGKDGDVVLYRSTDDGATWAAPVVVNDVPAAAREGLHAMAATPDGLVAITWLDLRQKGTRLYGAVSRDHGATWSPDVLVYASPDGAICECCHPSLAVEPAGGIAVMFRNHVAGARDLYVTRSKDGQTFSPAEKQGTGTWMLEACPMDGGGVTVTPAGTSSVWRRQDGIFLTTPGDPEQRLGTGRDPALAASAAGLDVVWASTEGIQLHRGGAPLFVGAGKAPALLAFPSHTLVAWEQQGQVVTKVVAR